MSAAAASAAKNQSSSDNSRSSGSSVNNGNVYPQPYKITDEFVLPTTQNMRSILGVTAAPEADLMRFLSESENKMTWAVNTYMRRNAPSGRRADYDYISFVDNKSSEKEREGMKDQLDPAPSAVKALLMKQPPDMLFRIAGFLSFKSLVALSSTCKGWHDLIFGTSLSVLSSADAPTHGTDFAASLWIQQLLHYNFTSPAPSSFKCSSNSEEMESGKCSSSDTLASATAVDAVEGHEEAIIRRRLIAGYPLQQWNTWEMDKSFMHKGDTYISVLSIERIEVRNRNATTECGAASGTMRRSVSSRSKFYQLFQSCALIESLRLCPYCAEIICLDSWLRDWQNIQKQQQRTIETVSEGASLQNQHQNPIVHIVPVMYGYPSAPLMRLAQQQKLVFGNDHLLPGAPSWACTRCRLQFCAYPYHCTILSTGKIKKKKKNYPTVLVNSNGVR